MPHIELQPQQNQHTPPGQQHCRRKRVWGIAARFATSGAACFLLNLMVMWLGTEMLHWHYLVVFAISWLVTLLVGFVLHRYWTFQATSQHIVPQFGRYALVYAGHIVVTFALMWVSVQLLHLAPWVASTLIAASLAVINFFVHKSWSFSLEKR